jgi:hypothetical protein
MSVGRTLTAAWLSGPTEVAVVGETFYAGAIRDAELSVQRGRELSALLMPEPENPHDPCAVAVYLEGRKAGHLPASVARTAQPALLSFAAAHDGQLVACPGIVRWHDRKPEVVLLLDTEPIGLPPEAFDYVPNLDQVLLRMLRKLDLPEPVTSGRDRQARERLADAEGLREATDADRDRSPGAWKHVERALRDAAGRLEAAGDPMASDAWTGIARSVRYQKGRRDDWMAAAVTALYWNRSNEHAWSELVELASAAPHVPTLLELFRRVPVPARPPVLAELIRISRSRDRLGNMRPTAGERLRAELADLAEADGDTASVAKLALDAKKRAPRSNTVRPSVID